MAEAEWIEIQLIEQNLEGVCEILQLLEEAGETVQLSDDLGRFWQTGPGVPAEEILTFKPWEKPGSHFSLRYDPEVLQRVRSSSPAVRNLEKAAAAVERAMRETTIRFRQKFNKST